MSLLLITAGLLAIVLSWSFQLNRYHIGVAVIAGVLAANLDPIVKHRRQALNPRRKLLTASSKRWTAKSSSLLIGVAMTTLAWVNVLVSSESEVAFGITLALLCALVYIQIAASGGRARPGLILSEIISINYLAILHVLLLTPGLVGVDPWFHAAQTREVLDSGSVSISASFYPSFPTFYIITAEVSSLTGLGIFGSFHILWIVFSLAMVFVFLFGRSVSGVKSGLLAALIFSVADYYLFWQLWMVPYALGFLFVLCLLVAVFKASEEKRAEVVLVVVLSVAIAAIHPLLGLIAAVMMLLIVLTDRFLGRKVSASNGRIRREMPASYVLMLGVIVLSWWIYVANVPGSSPLDTLVSVVRSSLRSFDLGEVTAVTRAGSLPYAIVAFNEAGYSILVALGIAGFLKELHREQMQLASVYSLGIPCAFLVAAPYVLGLGGLAAVLGYRWLIFGYPLLAIFASMYLLQASHAARKDTGKRNAALVVAVVLALTFTMTTSTLGDSVSPLYPSTHTRQWYNAAELAAPSFVLLHAKTAQVMTDERYGESVLHYWYGCCSLLVNLTPDLTYPPGTYYILIRKALHEEPIAIGTTGYSYIYAPVSATFWTSLEQEPTNLIYTNGATSVYLHDSGNP